MVREKVVQNEHTHVARFCLSGEGCAANDRSGTCSGWLLKTGYLTIAQLLGHDLVLFCYRVAFCRFHLISGPGCQLHFSWRIVNCASRECGAAQPLATLGFRALRRWWLWICWRWELLSWPLPESDEFQGRNIRPQLNTRKFEWRHVATGKTTRSQGPAISVEECQHLSCCKTTGSEYRYKI